MPLVALHYCWWPQLRRVISRLPRAYRRSNARRAAAVDFRMMREMGCCALRARVSFSISARRSPHAHRYGNIIGFAYEYDLLSEFLATVKIGYIARYD